MKYLTLPQIERRLIVAEGQTILEAALAAGIPYPHSCTAGRCAACKSKLHSGQVTLNPHTRFALTDEEKAQGLILACRALPEGDVSASWLGEAPADAAGPPQGATVVALEQMTHDIRRLVIALDERARFRFTAGQYLKLTVDGAPARPYSMASRPDEELIELHVRAVPGGRTSSLIMSTLAAGDRVSVEGAFGSAFYRDAHEGPMIAVAGGSGLAPIKSIVETALAAGKTAPITIYFGARAARDLYLVEHFRDLAARHAHVAYHAALSEEPASAWRSGFVSEAIAADHAILAGAKAYVAGPPAMVDAVQAVLSAQGVAPDDIHADSFFTPENA
ncbi:MAG: NADH:ubiquinone reductase (Na(+)-transporting) subunit F [Pseudomonadota bacterium]